MDYRVIPPVVLRVAWKLALVITILVAARFFGEWVSGKVLPHLEPDSQGSYSGLILISMAAYIFLMMLPFAPGVEVGIGLLMMFGPPIAPLVYVGTVMALTISFLIGRIVPQNTIIRMFEFTGMNRIADLLRKLKPLDTDARLQFILQNASWRAVPLLLRYRLLGLVAALNLPGNMVIGGGGGICMVAGFCRLFTIPSFLLAVAIAVAPVPLLVYLADMWF